ncbi:MAG: substrate-binding domain-containing protein, partial [Dehalococcoidia bacterium]
MKKLRLIAVIVIVLISLVGVLTACDEGGIAPLQAKDRLRVATTTSLYDTGLWGYLEPQFEEKYDIEVDVLNAGTGKALAYGANGDVDVITVHSKSRELKFVEDGYGLERVPFAYNYFLIIGPESDPAGVSGISPEDAFKQLMSSGQSNADVK